MIYILSKLIVLLKLSKIQAVLFRFV